MYRITFLFITFIAFSFAAENNVGLQFSGVETEYINSKGEHKQIRIEREVDPKCMNVHISNDMFWETDYASTKSV